MAASVSEDEKLAMVTFALCSFPAGLDAWHCPTHGIVTLPTWIDWSPRKTYNLEDKFDTAASYHVVISEAKPAEMAGYLDRDTLIRIWFGIGMSQKTAQVREQHFPELKSSE
jgi:hypothetical protein